MASSPVSPSNALILQLPQRKRTCRLLGCRHTCIYLSTLREHECSHLTGAEFTRRPEPVTEHPIEKLTWFELFQQIVLSPAIGQCRGHRKLVGAWLEHIDGKIECMSTLITTFQKRLIVSSSGVTVWKVDRRIKCGLKHCLETRLLPVYLQKHQRRHLWSADRELGTFKMSPCDPEVYSAYYALIVAELEPGLLPMSGASQEFRRLIVLIWFAIQHCESRIVDGFGWLTTRVDILERALKAVKFGPVEKYGRLRRLRHT